jgi:hypothetical protein
MINMAKLIWAFDLEPVGKEVDDDIETAFVDGFSTCPKVFPIQFNHRSKEHDGVLRKELEGTTSILEKYEVNNGKYTEGHKDHMSQRKTPNAKRKTQNTLRAAPPPPPLLTLIYFLNILNIS